MMTSILAGFASADITPPMGYKRSQWGGQSLPSTRVIRPLRAKAAVFCDAGNLGAGNAVAIVSADLCLLSYDITRRVEQMLAAVVPTQPIALVINASHSHQAPVLLTPGDATYDMGYDQLLVERIGSAVAAAWRARQPVTLTLAQKQTQGLNRNRRRKDGPVDRTLSVVEARGADGKLAGALWHFAAHPLSAMNTRAAWDPDFPGVASEMLEARHGSPFHYLQGAAGDVFPLDWYLHQDPPSRPTCLESATYLGERLAEEIESLIGQGESVDGDGAVRSSHRMIELPTRTPMWTVAEAEAAHRKYGAMLDHSVYEEWKSSDHVNTIAQTYEDRYRWVCAAFAIKIAKDVGKRMECRLWANRVGRLVFPVVPGELFSESGIELRDHRPDAKTLVLPYSNDNLLYLPPTHDLDEVQDWPLEEFLGQKKNRWAYGATATALIGQGGAEAIVATQKRMMDGLF